MAISLVDLTGNVADILASTFDPRRTKVWVETNVEGNMLVDTDTSQVRLGTATATVAADGSFAFTDLIATDSASLDPVNFQYRLHVDYADAASKQRVRQNVGWFSLPITADLTDVVEEQYVPPTYLSAAVATLDGYVTDAETARDAADTSADAAAASAALAGSISGLTSNDAAQALLISTPATAVDGALKAAYARLPAAAEQTIYLTTRGNDSNDGLTPKSAKLTLAAAVTALGGNPGRIQVGAGNISSAATQTIPNGTQIIGAGRGMTTLTYTGSGVFLQGTSATRTYNIVIAHLAIAGPGKATATTGIDMVDISQFTLYDFLISTFGIGIKHRSTSSGWAVYNRFQKGFFTSCGTGVDFGLTGSNGTSWQDVKWGACDIGVNLVDSNQNNFHACQFEVNTVGIYCEATLAGRADHNSFTFCRFESNTTAWIVNSANVRRFTVVYPATFSTYTFTNNSPTTQHITSGSSVSTFSSTVADAAGSWRYDRSASGGSSTPAVVFSDSATASGTPVTVQAETGRLLGSFFRGVRSATTYFDVRADGIVTKTSDITPFLTKTASYSARAGSTSNPADGTIVCNGATVTISLPDPTTTAIGQRFTVKNINAASATVNSAGTSKTLDGAASQSLAQWAKASYISDGAQWLTI